ncbi:LysR family transcriptional regulator [Pusillimonas sp. ANT_WB101]|uniref:LysR family transcriptional regulator n=1 Tax=Pusillimonas sp. ANT_WB101 TaxID=2597356 RepID=UPI0011EBF2B1|nr:LysR family transcriptional regulator [Pusillimonas sp. ANT_WB101]KAA0910514.1 LysR family transcriptional regulator [Pusillimonas sp. ANT_WB101]
MQINSARLSAHQLRAFVNLAQLKSFTRAAAASHLSQPAFSALIRALETEVGARLFDRSTRHVDLTVEGRDFFDGAQRVLAEIEAALASVRERVELKRGRVALALLPSLAAGWLPDVLAAFHAQFPDIELEVFDVLSENCIESVRSGRADIAIAATRVDTPELRAEPFQTDEFYLVARRGHPLLDRANLKPRDLQAFDFIHLSRDSSVRQYLDAATLPLKMRTLIEVDQLATVMGMVRAGLGISVVPALTLFHFQHPEIETRLLRWPGLRRSIYLIKRRDKGLSVAAQALYERLVKGRKGESVVKTSRTVKTKE